MASGAQPFAHADDLAAITAPTLVVPGTDPTHPPEAVAPYRQIPHVTILAADPSTYAAAITTFLTDRSGSP